MTDTTPTWDEVVGAFVDAQVLANRYRSQNDDDCLECETLDDLATSIDRVVKELEAIE